MSQLHFGLVTATSTRKVLKILVFVRLRQSNSRQITSNGAHHAGCEPFSSQPKPLSGVPQMKQTRARGKADASKSLVKMLCRLKVNLLAFSLTLKHETVAVQQRTIERRAMCCLGQRAPSNRSVQFVTTWKDSIVFDIQKPDFHTRVWLYSHTQIIDVCRGFFRKWIARACKFLSHSQKVLARFYARAVQLANWGALTRIILSGVLLSKFWCWVSMHQEL